LREWTGWNRKIDGSVRIPQGTIKSFVRPHRNLTPKRPGISGQRVIFFTPRSTGTFRCFRQGGTDFPNGWNSLRETTRSPPFDVICTVFKEDAQTFLVSKTIQEMCASDFPYNRSPLACRPESLSAARRLSAVGGQNSGSPASGFLRNYDAHKIL